MSATILSETMATRKLEPTVTAGWLYPRFAHDSRSVSFAPAGGGVGFDGDSGGGLCAERTYASRLARWA